MAAYRQSAVNVFICLIALSWIHNWWVFCRIDYHLASPSLAEKAKTASVYKDQRFSDHAPLTIEYGMSL